MAMIDIEYRFSDKALPDKDIRRKTTEEMEQYLRDLVFEMQSADISSQSKGVPTDGVNQLFINGMEIKDILNGLEIKMLEPDEETCGCTPRPLIIQRPALEWDQSIIEDIPDVLVKNAISKVYCDIQKNRIM